MKRTMNRRQLVASVGAAALVGGRGALAQTPGPPKRIGLMMAIAENDPEGLRRVEAFRVSLADAGWTDGRNVAIDVSWYGGSFQLAQAAAKAHADRKVDVIVVNGTPGMDALRAAGTSLPMVFVVVSNPVGAGYVPNLSRPGANITGFSTFEPEIVGKWLQLLRAGGARSEECQHDARPEVHRRSTRCGMRPKAWRPSRASCPTRRSPAAWRRSSARLP